MQLPIKTRLFPIKLSVTEYKYLINFIENMNFKQCNNQTLIMMYQWHKQELINKLVIGYHKAMIGSKYESTIKVNEIEKHLVSIYYKENDFAPFLIVVFEKFIKGLTKYSSHATV